MEITDIRIKRVESDNKLKAYVTITFDNCFVVHNLKIIMGQFGRFVAMPSRKTRDGEFKDIAHPINSVFRIVSRPAFLRSLTKMREKCIFRARMTRTTRRPAKWRRAVQRKMRPRRPDLSHERRA